MPQYSVGFDPTQPVQLVFSSAAKPGNREIAEQIIYNRDPVIPLLLAFDAPHQQPDFTSSRVSIVDPLSSTVVNGTVDVWGVGLPGGVGALVGVVLTADESPPVLNTGQTVIIVDVVTTGIGASGNPLAIATAIAVSGLPLLIAQQIAQSGLSLVGNPVLLYNGQIISTSGASGGWGSTIPAGAPPLYGLASNNYAGARTAFDNLIGIPSGSAKVFPGTAPGVLPLTPTPQMSAAIAAGLRIYLCYKPAFNPPTATERTNLLASINAMKAACTAAGTGATIAGVILWQEVNSGNDLTAAQYATVVNFYGPAITGAGYALGHCVTAGQATNWATYFSAGSFTATISFIAVDIYATAYNNGTRLDGNGANNINTIAAAYAPPLSVGLFEMGSTAVTGVVPSNAVIAAYLTYLQGFMVNRVIAGLTNVDCIWFDGPGTGNCIFLGTDFRIPLLQTFINAITNVPITGIAGGASAVVAPLNPTPTGNFALSGSLSYDVIVNLTAGAGSTNPFAAVRFQWVNFDIVTARAVKTVTWRCPAGANGTPGAFTNGVGPMHGQFLKVTIFNLDTVQMSVQLQVNATGRPTAKHNWWWDAPVSQAIPGFTLPGGAAFANSFGSANGVSVPASSSVTRLFSMFSGECFFRFAASAANFLTATLAPMPASEFGSAALINQVAGATDIEQIFIAPRGPLLLTVANSDGAAAHTFNAEIVGND